MGRIKSTFVKSSANRIYEREKEEFSTDFEKNKQLVMEYAEIPSKRLRNSIAGYITRLVRKSQEEEQ